VRYVDRDLSAEYQQAALAVATVEGVTERSNAATEERLKSGHAVGWREYRLTPCPRASAGSYSSFLVRARGRRWAVWETRLRVFQAAVGAFLASTAAAPSTASVVVGTRPLADPIAFGGGSGRWPHAGEAARRATTSPRCCRCPARVSRGQSVGWLRTVLQCTMAAEDR
jgi:hypothetical protein